MPFPALEVKKSYTNIFTVVGREKRGKQIFLACFSSSHQNLPQ